MALLCSQEQKIPEELLKGWADCVGREHDYGHMSQTPLSRFFQKYSVCLLAAVFHAFAMVFGSGYNGDVSVICGIHTFQDDQILAQLRARNVDDLR